MRQHDAVAAQPAPAFGRAHHPKKDLVAASATPVAWTWADMDSVAWNLAMEKADAWRLYGLGVEQLFAAGHFDAVGSMSHAERMYPYRLILQAQEAEEAETALATRADEEAEAALAARATEEAAAALAARATMEAAAAALAARVAEEAAAALAARVTEEAEAALAARIAEAVDAALAARAAEEDGALRQVASAIRRVFNNPQAWGDSAVGWVVPPAGKAQAWGDYVTLLRGAWGRLRIRLAQCARLRR
jgi:hypothetical protein